MYQWELFLNYKDLELTMNIMKIKILSLIFLTICFSNLKTNAQTQFILDNEKSIIGIPIYFPNTDSIIVKKFDGTIDTISKSNIVFENDVKVSIITNTTNYINVHNLQIIDSTYQFTFRKKDIILHKDSVIRFSEKVKPMEFRNNNNWQDDIENRSMIGAGLGFPYLFMATLDKSFNENVGGRININFSIFPSISVDFYSNLYRSENIEHNISVNSGLMFLSDFVHGGGAETMILYGTTYDLKIYSVMIRAGILYAHNNGGNTDILPNVSVGFIFEI